MPKNKRTHKTDFIINKRAGTVLRVGEKRIRKAITDNFDPKRLGEIIFVDGGDIADTVRAWKDKNKGQMRGIVIGGGDGSVVTAATELMQTKDVILGVLPFGTQNLVARRLGFSTDFKKAVAQYKNSTVTTLDVGQVNGMNFLVGLMADQNSVRFFEIREDIRDKRHFAALKKEFALAALQDSTFSIDGRETPAHVLAVMNNEIRPRKNRFIDMFNVFRAKDVAGNIFAQDPEGDGKLALYAVRAEAAQIFSLLEGLRKGTWIDSASVLCETASAFKITAADTVETSIILDGEIRKTSFPLDVSIVPQGIRVYKPK